VEEQKALRFFLTSFQKSGTHQAMPMFTPDLPQIEDLSYVSHKGMDAWGFSSDEYPREGYEQTVEQLRSYEGKAFGHMPYLPEYAEALASKPTKVVFNVRDPRDVVIAEVAYIKIHEKKNELARAWLNYRRVSDGKCIHELDDPILEMIKVDAVRWRNWIGWLDHDFVIRLRFEDLRLRPEETATALLKKLKGCGLVQPPPTMVKRSRMGRQPGSKSPSFRKGLVGEHKKYFRKRHHELARELMGDIIIKLGYQL